MPANLKTHLSDFFDSLDGVPPEKQAEFKQASALLKHKRIQIPENEKGEREVIEYICFLFTTTPELRNDSNKVKWKNFAEENLSEYKNHPGPTKSK